MSRTFTSNTDFFDTRASTDNIGSFNNNSFNNVSNNFTFTAADEESKVLAWLSPLEPQVRHQDIRKQRVESVGDWLLEKKEFKSWYNGSGRDECDHAVLFCYGDPGVGKSYISSLVVDYLCDQAVEQGMAVACFYYDFALREEQSPENMLGSVLKQLLSGLEAIPVEITRKFKSQKGVIGGRELQLRDVVNMFPTISSLRRAFICVDALDECAPKHRLGVLDSLRQILQRSPNTRMFMTGRPHIRGVVDRELGGGARSVLIKPRDDDIVTYLRARLRKDTTPEVMDSGLENDILKIIPGEVSESFLLVSLKVEAILRETTIHRRRRRLHAEGDELELGSAYEETLGRIRAQDGEKTKLAMAALMWICYSERPLQVAELCHALAVEIGSTDFNSDNIPAIETLLACCQGLVTVDNEAATVRLIHNTVQEHLATDPSPFPQAHSVMAETCLTYLNSDQVKALSAKPQPDYSSMPFLKYCSRYWGTHANRELSSHTRSLATELLDQCENHVAAKALFEQILEPYDSPEVNSSSLFGGLHCASFFGIVEIMSAVLGLNSCDANQRDSLGMTPLAWAVRSEHVNAVEQLLGREDIDPNIQDNNGNTPLMWAVFKGHESVIKQLLDREDVNPDRPDSEDRTPLHWAANKGHESVVKQLLNREDINPDRPDNEDRTPLHWAANNGHESVVKQLLDREDINPDRQDDKGRTPLYWAVRKGHESVVKQLLDREDVNPDRSDSEGYTPLLQAAARGYESVVKQLLDRENVNPDRPDSEGYTPLLQAAARGYESVVKQLLNREDVNPDRQDDTGGTPLYWAARKGHESVVKQLLDREDVNPDRQDDKGRTPLYWAAFKGHESVVKRLLDREDVNPARQEDKGRTPLYWATLNGHERVVKQLLDREDANPDRPDEDGNTPLP